MKPLNFLFLVSCTVTSLCAQQAIYKNESSGKDMLYRSPDDEVVIMKKSKQIQDRYYKVIVFEENEYLISSAHLRRGAQVVATFEQNHILIGNNKYSYAIGIAEWIYRRDTTVVMKVQYVPNPENPDKIDVIIDKLEQDSNIDVLSAIAFNKIGKKGSRAYKNTALYVVCSLVAILSAVSQLSP